MALLVEFLLGLWEDTSFQNHVVSDKTDADQGYEGATPKVQLPSFALGKPKTEGACQISG